MPDPLHSHVMSIDLEPITGTSRFVRFSREEVEQSIPARFERQACLYPEQIAVADAESTLTYRDLNGPANRIAHAALFDTATIERMAAHFETPLAGIVQNPDAAVAQLP